MKKKFALYLAFVMLAASVLTGCGNDSANSGDGDTAGQESYVFSLSTPVTETTVQGQEIHKFANLVNERSEGRITINPFFSNVLGNQKDMFTALANNEQELIMDGSITDYYGTEYSFIAAPFLIHNSEHLQAILDSDLFQQMKDALVEDNVAVIGAGIVGNRELYSAVELTSAADVSKLIIRMPDLISYIVAWSTIGAKVQVMGGSDVYSALSTGVVNSCEGGYSQAVSDKYSEVTEYIYTTNHISEPYFIYASQAWLDSLPEDIAQIITECAEEVMQDFTVSMAEEMENSKQQLIDDGMTYVDNIDFSELFDKMQPVYEEKFNSGEWTSSYEEIMSYYNG